MTLGRPALLALIERGNPRCQYCAGEITFPEDVRRYIDARGPVVATPERKRFFMPCPGCARKTRVEPDADVVRCSFCAIRFHAPDNAESPARLGPHRQAPLATVAETQAAVAHLPESGPWGIVRRALVGRAAMGELVHGEAEQLLALMSGVASWQPQPGVSFWPLPMSEASQLFARIVLGISEYSEYNHGHLVELLVVLKVGGRFDGSGAMTGIALDALASRPSWHYHREEPNHSTEARFQACVHLEATEGGVMFMVRNQIDQNPPTPLSSQQAAEIERRVVASRAVLQGYYVLAALMGESCRGGTTFSITGPALARRLESLGCPAPEPLIQALAIKMPPQFQ